MGSLSGSVLALLGTLLATFGTAIAAYGVYRDGQENAKRSRELAEKSEEIAGLNARIASLVTGGDSYCTVEFRVVAGSDDVGEWLLVHHGSFPVHDVRVEMVDTTYAREVEFRVTGEKVTGHVLKMLESYKQSVDLGTVSPMPSGSDAGVHRRRVFEPIELDRRFERIYNFRVFSRNAVVLQEWRLSQDSTSRWHGRVERRIWVNGKPPVVEED